MESRLLCSIRLCRNSKQRLPHPACYVNERKNLFLSSVASCQRLRGAPSGSEFREQGLWPSTYRESCTYVEFGLFQSAGSALVCQCPLFRPRFPPQAGKAIPTASNI